MIGKNVLATPFGNYFVDANPVADVLFKNVDRRTKFGKLHHKYMRLLEELEMIAIELGGELNDITPH